VFRSSPIIVAIVTVVAAIVLGGLSATPAQAAVNYTRCDPLPQTFSTIGSYRRCYFEGSIWNASGGFWEYTRGYDDQACNSVGGCYSIAGGRATNWYASGNTWIKWFCRYYNGGAWVITGC
jgi:hypothetical protein